MARADKEPAGVALKQNIEALAEALFKSIGMQLSVAKYGAANWERGAVLDALDMPLSDRPWLEAQFGEILANQNETERLAMLNNILCWDDPGPGGFYDDLGNPQRQPHLVQGKIWNEDPGFVVSPQNETIEVDGRRDWRKSWLNQAQTLFGEPLRMKYTGLDTGAAYRLRVTYAGRFRPTMRLIADGEYEIHGPLPQPDPVAPVDFTIPKGATQDGELNLEWQLLSGRGCQVAEVWLIQEH